MVISLPSAEHQESFGIQRVTVSHMCFHILSFAAIGFRQTLISYRMNIQLQLYHDVINIRAHPSKY